MPRSCHTEIVPALAPVVQLPFFCACEPSSPQWAHIDHTFLLLSRYFHLSLSLNICLSCLTPSPHSHLSIFPRIYFTLGLFNPGFSVNPIASGCWVLSVQRPRPSSHPLSVVLAMPLSTALPSAGLTLGILGQAHTGSSCFMLSRANPPQCSPLMEDGVHSCSFALLKIIGGKSHLFISYKTIIIFKYNLKL